MATKKAGGSTALGRDSQSKRLGIKIHDGQFAKPGAIIVRQRGSKIRAGKNVMTGVDYTLFASVTGKVHFRSKKLHSFTGALKQAKFVDVLPA